MRGYRKLAGSVASSVLVLIAYVVHVKMGGDVESFKWTVSAIVAAFGGFAVANVKTHMEKSETRT